MSEPTTAEMREQVYNFNWGDYPTWDGCDADWLQGSLLTLLNRLEAADKSNYTFSKDLLTGDQLLRKAEATIREMTEIIRREKFRMPDELLEIASRKSND